MNEKLTGIFTALVTPFNRDGAIIFDSLQKHVDFLVQQGVDGFYVNGSTSEAFLMTSEERKKVLEAVVEANHGRATVINHCGAIGTELSLELVRHSARLEVDALSAVPPFYYSFSEAELVGYYYDLANSSDKPFVVYNMPKYSGVVITPTLMSKLRQNSKIQGLKFTHNDLFALQQIKASDPDLIIYNGYDEIAICGFSLGCDGAIGSTYNVIAPLIIKLQNLCSRNDYHSALDVQALINEYIMLMSKKTGKLFAVLKYLISKIEGIEYGICRKPFATLTDEDIALCDTLLANFNFY